MQFSPFWITETDSYLENSPERRGRELQQYKKDLIFTRGTSLRKIVDAFLEHFFPAYDARRKMWNISFSTDWESEGWRPGEVETILACCVLVKSFIHHQPFPHPMNRSGGFDGNGPELALWERHLDIPWDAVLELFVEHSRAPMVAYLYEHVIPCPTRGFTYVLRPMLEFAKLHSLLSSAKREPDKREHVFTEIEYLERVAGQGRGGSYSVAPQYALLAYPVIDLTQRTRQVSTSRMQPAREVLYQDAYQTVVGKLLNHHFETDNRLFSPFETWEKKVIRWTDEFTLRYEVMRATAYAQPKEMVGWEALQGAREKNDRWWSLATRGSYEDLLCGVLGIEVEEESEHSSGGVRGIEVEESE